MMLTFKEFKEACKEDMPDEAVVNKGEAINFKTQEKFWLVGYKWQSYIDFLNNLDIIWSKEIRTVKDYPLYKKMAACIRIHIKCSDGETFFDGYGISEFKFKDDQMDMSLTGKSAVDDALGRACASFGLGLKTYKGKEDRGPKLEEGKDYKKLFNGLRESKKAKLGIATDEKLADFLDKKGFDFGLISNQSDDKEVFYWDKMVDKDYEKLYTFIEENHPEIIKIKLIRKYKELVGTFKKQEGEIENVKDFKLPNSIYPAFRKLANQFGSELLKKVDKLPISSVNSIEAWTRYLTNMCQEKQKLDEDIGGIGEN